jgi:hypothetical protein
MYREYKPKEENEGVHGILQSLDSYGNIMQLNAGAKRNM